MTRRKMHLGADELIEPGTYVVEIVNARSHIPQNPTKTAAVYVALEVLEGVDAGKLTEVRINVPTDAQQSGYRDGGKAYRRSLEGIRKPFAAAARAAGAGDDDDAYFAVLTDELVGTIFVAQLGFGKGQWSNRQELVKTLPADESS